MGSPLEESHMVDPYSKFAEWFTLAEENEPIHPNACALATVAKDAEGSPIPDIRIVLMKLWDKQGFVFYTNHESAKGQQLADTPVAALNFHWKSLHRQVRVRGAITHISGAESDAYFATRPYESQVSAWASLQSQPMKTREEFEDRIREFSARFPDIVPRPDFWGGYRLTPKEIEFWEERDGRQHHRLCFTATGDGWTSSLIYP